MAVIHPTIQHVPIPEAEREAARLRVINRWERPDGEELVEDSFAPTSQPTIYWDKMRANVARDLAHHRLAGFVVEVVPFEEVRS